MDWDAKINKTLVLADNKTGKSTYPDMGIQLAAGGKAEFILQPDGTQEAMPHYDRYGILHIRPRYFGSSCRYQTKRSKRGGSSLRR